MNIEQKIIAIEEFLASEVIKRGKLLKDGADLNAVRIIIDKMCMNCCGGKWEFGTYFFIDETIRVYFKFIDEDNNIRDFSKHIFSKSEVEDFVYTYMENGDLNFSKLSENTKAKDEVKKELTKKTKKKKEENLNEQMSLF